MNKKKKKEKKTAEFLVYIFELFQKNYPPPPTLFGIRPCL